MNTRQNYYIRKRIQFNGQKKSQLCSEKTKSISQLKASCPSGQKITLQKNSSLYHTNPEKIKLQNFRNSQIRLQKQLTPLNEVKILSRYQKYDQKQHKIITPSLNNSANMIQQYKRRTIRLNLLQNIRINCPLYIFFKKVEDQQHQFIKLVNNQNYQLAAQILINLMNYSIDLNLTLYFAKNILLIGQFYLLINHLNQALFYFNQARQCCLLLETNQICNILIQSLMGISKCCSKINMQHQSIIILKKALEYAWYYDKKDLQLLLYDQIGQKYYHLGEISTAKKYHYRYTSSITQPNNSTYRLLSKQRIKKMEQINIQSKFNQLNLTFLVHLKVPISSTEQLLPLQSDVQISKVRHQFHLGSKYFTYFQQLQQQINRLLKTWFFIEEMDQPSLPNENLLPLKKHIRSDLKLNLYLKQFNSNPLMKNKKKNNKMQFKESLDQKIKRRLKQPILQPQWYQILVKQISRDRKNKLLHVRDSVRIRAYNKPIKPSIQIIKQTYNKFFEAPNDIYFFNKI